jgi:hypothetical protein
MIFLGAFWGKWFSGEGLTEMGARKMYLLVVLFDVLMMTQFG